MILPASAVVGANHDISGYIIRYNSQTTSGYCSAGMSVLSGITTRSRGVAGECLTVE